MIPEVNVETLMLHGLGEHKVEWLIRSVDKYGPTVELKHNVVIHIYHVADHEFLDKMKIAWETSGLANQGIALERSYTDRLGDFEIDAYDAILYDIDPCFAESYKDTYLRAVAKLYEPPPAPKQQDEEDEDEEETE